MQKLDGLLLTDTAIKRSFQEQPAAEAGSGKAERFAFQLNQVSSSEEGKSEGTNSGAIGPYSKLASWADTADGEQIEIDQDAWLNIVEELKSVVMQNGENSVVEKESVISDEDIEAVLADLLELDTNGKSLPPDLETLSVLKEGLEEKRSGLLGSLNDLVDSLSRYNDSSEMEGAGDSEQLNEAVLQASETLQNQLKHFFNDDELPEVINEITQYLVASIEENGQINMDDLEPLIAELQTLLNSVQDMKVPISKSDLVAALQTHLQALQNNSGAANEHRPADTGEMARINQLLAQLEQGPHISERSNQLSAAGDALNKVTQQFKAQLEAMKSAGESSGKSAADSEIALDAGEQTRRSSGEQLQTLVSGESRLTSLGNTQVNQLPNSNMAQARDGALGRTAEAPLPSTFEVARQTQQIIDILGPGAADRLRERVSVMFNTRTQAAEMRLDPPDLGRLTIRLNMNQEQATVNFQVTTPQAREALEQSLHRLRELLHEQGIALADANVSEQQSGNKQEHTSQASNYDGLAGSEEDFSEADQVITVESPVVGADGSVDYYA